MCGLNTGTCEKLLHIFKKRKKVATRPRGYCDIYIYIYIMTLVSLLHSGISKTCINSISNRIINIKLYSFLYQIVEEIERNYEVRIYI